MEEIFAKRKVDLMWILNQDRNVISNGKQVIEISGKVIRCNGDRIASYQTKEEVQAAFDDIVNQIDDIDGVVRVK
ncbi:MAG: hypothetical protein IJ728_13395 [Selenomonadaceae bacterium]|nr:hypothetical protein [Selenomonadaceae bacterium]